MNSKVIRYESIGFCSSSGNIPQSPLDIVTLHFLQLITKFCLKQLLRRVTAQQLEAALLSILKGGKVHENCAVADHKLIRRLHNTSFLAIGVATFESKKLPVTKIRA